jgi:cell division protein FtsL
VEYSAQKSRHHSQKIEQKIDELNKKIDDVFLQMKKNGNYERSAKDDEGSV